MGSRKCYRGFGSSCDLSSPTKPPKRTKPYTWRRVKVDGRQRSIDSDKFSVGQRESITKFGRGLLTALFGRRMSRSGASGAR